MKNYSRSVIYSFSMYRLPEKKGKLPFIFKAGFSMNRHDSMAKGIVIIVASKNIGIGLTSGIR